MIAPAPPIPVWVRRSQRQTSGRQWAAGGPAFVQITLSWRGTEWFEDFLLDTGAGRTVLGTVAAIELLRDDYFLIDFEHDASRVVMGGIGGGIRCVQREVDLSFRTETGEPFRLTAPILIPELVDAPRGRPPFHTPSLLGRDLLGGGSLTLVWQLPTQVEFSNMPSGVGL